MLPSAIIYLKCFLRAHLALFAANLCAEFVSSAHFCGRNQSRRDDDEEEKDEREKKNTNEIRFKQS